MGVLIMPITKQDVQGFGDTLRNTLAIWGEQIQQGRDYAKLQKVQNQLANVKNFTTDDKGNPLGYEDIAKKIMGVTNQLSDIRTPNIMDLARADVSNFVKTNLAGVQQDVQNRFDVGMDAIQNPQDAKQVQNLINQTGIPRGMYQFKPGSSDTYYTSKLVNESIIREDGSVDPEYVNQKQVGITKRGKPYEIPLGKIYIKDLTNVQKMEEAAKNRASEEYQSKLAQSRSTYSYSTGDRFVSFQDPVTKQVTNIMYKGSKPYYADGKTPVSQEDIIKFQHQTPISENITPKDDNVDVETSYKRLKQMLPDVDDQNSLVGNIISRWISADATTEESVWNEIHNMFPDNKSIRDLIWDLKKRK